MTNHYPGGDMASERPFFARDAYVLHFSTLLRHNFWRAAKRPSVKEFLGDGAGLTEPATSLS